MKNSNSLLNSTVVKQSGSYLTLSNGYVIEYYIRKKPIVKKAPATLLDYLRSIGVEDFYVDKRKTGYRVKVYSDFTPKQLKQLKKMDCELFTTISEERRMSVLHTLKKDYIIISCTIAPSQILI